MNSARPAQTAQRALANAAAAIALLAALLPPADARAPSAVTLQRADGRSLPAAVYAPARQPCAGIAVISHGAGGSESGYGYLAAALAERDYLTLVVGHTESGSDALRDRIRSRGIRQGLGELVSDAAAYRGRLMDVTAAKGWARQQCAAPRSVLLGHSMGAATVMIEAGAANALGVHGSDAFDAYVALSPQGPGPIFPEGAWQAIRKPVLLVTGTRDSELGGDSRQHRTLPFANLQPGCKWLLVVSQATHMHFAGRGAGSARTEAATVAAVEDFLASLGAPGCPVPPRARDDAIQSK